MIKDLVPLKKYFSFYLMTIHAPKILPLSRKEKKVRFKFNNSIQLLFPLKLFINLKIKKIYLLAYKS